MNIYKIINFIGKKNPKYDEENSKKYLPPLRRVPGKGYRDKNGKQGQWELYNPDNTKTFLITFVDNEEQGYQELYTDSGAKICGNMKNGNKDGVWKTIWNDGTYLAIEIYDDGKLISREFPGLE